MTAAAAIAPRFMTVRQAVAIEAGMRGNGTPAARNYARQHERAWARLRSVESMLGDHAAAAMAENERYPGAAAAHATDLAHVVALLGDALRLLGKGVGHAG